MEVVTNYSDIDSPPLQREAFYDIIHKYNALPEYDDAINAFLLTFPDGVNISKLEEELNDFGIEIIEIID